MGKSNKNNNQATENKQQNVPEVPAEKPEVAKVALGDKIKGGIKEHGKKILAGVGLVIGGAIAYGLGVKKGQAAAGDSDDYDGIDYYKLDAVEAEDYVAEN